MKEEDGKRAVHEGGRVKAVMNESEGNIAALIWLVN